MRSHCIVGLAVRGLLIGLVPALLVGCAKTQSKPTIPAGNARFEFLTPSLVRMVRLPDPFQKY